MSTQSLLSALESLQTSIVLEQSAVQQSAVEQSAVEQSAVEQSAVEQSAVEQSAVEQSAVEQLNEAMDEAHRGTCWVCLHAENTETSS
jgi:hypothetical protein